MADLNEVRLIGRLTRDVEIRSTSSGQRVAHFGIATSKKYKAQDGTVKEEVFFIDVVSWGTIAENAAKYIGKGRAVFVGGRLKLDTWDDKQTGAKRSKISVFAENIQYLDKPKAQGNNEAAPQIPDSWDNGPAGPQGEPPF